MTAHRDDDVPAGFRAAWREGRVVDDIGMADDRRGPDPGRRDGDGGEGARTDSWVRYLIPIIVAGLVAYFTAIGAVRENVAQVKTTEQNHFDEVLRRLALIQAWQDRQDGRRESR